MRAWWEQVAAYPAADEAEAAAKAALLCQWDEQGPSFLQRPAAGHITVSAMVLNQTSDKLLMVYHNIYQSLAWPGGHADGAEDLLQKAMEEVQEETGVVALYPLTSAILSVDCLPVQAHVKRGTLVDAHVHYNITYGFVASEQQPLRIKPDENSRVCWVPLTEWRAQCSEQHMIPVYEKVISRMLYIQKDNRLRYAKLPTVLLPWYAQNARDLPWRKDKDPYHIWLSEIMLQQTRVEAVKGYYQRFLETLPDIAALAAVPEDQLLKLWEGLGYYTRARNLQKAAKVIMADYGGKFPQRYTDILALPGIGAYTAGAISAICFDAPTPAVDGNVVRVLSRILEDFADVLAPATKTRMAEALANVYPSGSMAYTFNQSLMELGATICLPNGQPKCEVCPMQCWCRAYANESWDKLPQKAAKKKRRVEEKTIFLLRCGEKMAVEKRPKHGLLAGLWQLPNVEGYLDGQAALDQAVVWGCKPVQVEQMLHGKHIFTHVEWHMQCYVLRCVQESPCFVWISPDQLAQEIALPTAFRIFLQE